MKRDKPKDERWGRGRGRKETSPRSFTCAIFREISFSRLVLNRTETLSTRARVIGSQLH